MGCDRIWPRPTGYTLGRAMLAEESPGVWVRIKDDALKSVVFFGSEEADANGAIAIRYRGTGFFIKRQGFVYLVTAKHVAKALPAPFFIRANLRDGRAAPPKEVARLDWGYHTDEKADVAVALYGLGPQYDCVPIDTNEILQQDQIDARDVRPGDLVQIVGLFRLVAGKARNLPVVHTGYISMMTSGSETIPVKATRISPVIEMAPAYLVEAQTLDGLSGSPVWLPAYGEAKLFGIYIAAFVGEPGQVLAADIDMESNKVRVPVGMGVVVPAYLALQTLQCETLEKGRQAAKNAPPDAAVGDYASEPAASPLPVQLDREGLAYCAQCAGWVPEVHRRAAIPHSGGSYRHCSCSTK